MGRRYLPENIYRALDANLNRAAEGLRVLEDAVRFVLNDAPLTDRLKNLRHSLLAQINHIPGKEKLIISRDSERDVGARIAEQSREEFEDLLVANFRRVQEAVRSLEEFVKLISPTRAEKFRQLRFQTYTVEKVIKTKMNKQPRDYSLYAITESSLPFNELLDKVNEAVKSGISALQLREKGISSRDFLKRALRIREIVPPGVLFMVNDRVDIARGSDADGVHLGQDDLPISLAREIMGDDKLIGVSTHNLEEAKEAQAQGADYIGIGPVFSTTTKLDTHKSVGSEFISYIKGKVGVPVVAIGGINQDNIRSVLEAGADGVAIVSAIFKQDDVGEAVKTLREIIDEFDKSKAGNTYKK